MYIPSAERIQFDQNVVNQQHNLRLPRIDSLLKLEQSTQKYLASSQLGLDKREYVAQVRELKRNDPQLELLFHKRCNFFYNLAKLWHGEADYVADRFVTISKDIFAKMKERANVSEHCVAHFCIQFGPDDRAAKAELVLSVLSQYIMINPLQDKLAVGSSLTKLYSFFRDYQEYLYDDQKREFATNLIDQLSGLSRHDDSIRAPHEALKALELFAPYLSSSLQIRLLTTLFQHGSGVNQYSCVVRAPRTALYIINTYYPQLLSAQQAESMLLELLNIYCDNQQLALSSNDVEMVVETVKELKKFLVKNRYNSLLYSQIKWWSELTNSAKMRNGDIAAQLLDWAEAKLPPENWQQLVKDFITGAITLRHARARVANAYAGVEFLVRNKQWLAEQEPELFKTALTNLWQSPHFQVISTLLENFEEYYSDQQLEQLYNTTSSELIARTITEYLNGAGRWRPLELMERPFLLPHQDHLRPLGMEFEIHNVSMGIDTYAEPLLTTLLADAKVTLQTFKVQDLLRKLGVIIGDPELRHAMERMVHYLLEDQDYAVKFQNILPLIASLLNSDLTSWGVGFQTAASRWEAWLKFSLGESAYAGKDEHHYDPHCTRGAYEHLISGLISLHPAIELLYSPALMLEAYINNIVNKIIEQVPRIISQLQQQVIIENNETKSLIQIKQQCHKLLLQNFESDLAAKQQELLTKCQQLPHARAILKDALPRLSSKFQARFSALLKDYIGAIADIPYPQSQNDESVTDYILNQLQVKPG